MYIKILKFIIGMTLIALGVIALFVPFIPGILLILAGLFLAEIRIEQVKKWWKKIKF